MARKRRVGNRRRSDSGRGDRRRQASGKEPGARERGEESSDGEEGDVVGSGDRGGTQSRKSSQKSHGESGRAEGPARDCIRR